ncbi:MAG: response regulator [Holophagales bacterium]|nr:response regulator [Holophagales bacterium]
MLLLADDNPTLRQPTAEYLRRKGFEVLEADDGARAAALLASGEQPIAALITDRDMPGLDGIELLHLARRVRPGLPALLVTSRPPTGAEAEGLEILAKPYDPAELVAWLQRQAPETEPSPGRASPGAAARRGLLPAAAVVLIGLGLAATWQSTRSPSLPPPPGPGTVRGATIDGLRPSGPLARAPESFSWRPVDGAASYLLELVTVDDRVLWSHELEVPDPGPIRGERDTPTVAAAVPEPIRQQLVPNVAYFLRVEARDRQGQVVAATRGLRLRVVRAAEAAPDRETRPSEESP